VSIEALYPSRRHPQHSNPLFRREYRRERVIPVLALGFCVLSMGAWWILPSESFAEARVSTPQTTSMLPASDHHFRVIPLYNIPPEQRGGSFANQS
jgi:hypothetical protein